jgi:hypothetical protein
MKFLKRRSSIQRGSGIQVSCENARPRQSELRVRALLIILNYHANKDGLDSSPMQITLSSRKRYRRGATYGRKTANAENAGQSKRRRDNGCSSEFGGHSLRNGRTGH